MANKYSKICKHMQIHNSWNVIHSNITFWIFRTTNERYRSQILTLSTFHQPLTIRIQTLMQIGELRFRQSFMGVVNLRTSPNDTEKYRGPSSFCWMLHVSFHIKYFQKINCQVYSPTSYDFDRWNNFELQNHSWKCPERNQEKWSFTKLLIPYMY